MLKLTRLNRSLVAINPDQILWVEASPDTTLFLAGGDKLIVRETLEELIQEFVELKRRIHGEPYVLARDPDRSPFASGPPSGRAPMSMPQFPSLLAPPRITSRPPASQPQTLRNVATQGASGSGPVSRTPLSLAQPSRRGEEDK